MTLLFQNTCNAKNDPNRQNMAHYKLDYYALYKLDHYNFYNNNNYYYCHLKQKHGIHFIQKCPKSDFKLIVGRGEAGKAI